MDSAAAETSQETEAAPVEAVPPAVPPAAKPGARRAARRSARSERIAPNDQRGADARRSRVEMTRVDLWSVLKITLCFYLAGLAILILAGLVVWLLLDASGGIHKFERFMGDILSAKDFHLVAPQILAGSVLVGLVLVALMTIVTVIAAALYNVFSDLIGGVEVTLVEAE